MGVVRRLVGPRDPSIRLPVLVPMLVPVLVRSEPGHEPELVQRLLEQRDETAYLPLPIFCGRPFIRLGR